MAPSSVHFVQLPSPSFPSLHQWEAIQDSLQRRNHNSIHLWDLSQVHIEEPLQSPSLPVAERPDSFHELWLWSCRADPHREKEVHNIYSNLHAAFSWGFRRPCTAGHERGLGFTKLQGYKWLLFITEGKKTPYAWKLKLPEEQNCVNVAVAGRQLPVQLLRVFLLPVSKMQLTVRCTPWKCMISRGQNFDKIRQLWLCAKHY